MIENVAVRQLNIGGLTIEGYSRAAVQSYWRIAELKLGFDLGAHPWEFMGTPTWFISHSHLDHIAALPVYIARRRMMKMEPPTIYVPAHIETMIKDWLKFTARLDRGRLPCTIVPVEPGQELEISRELVVTAAAMTHTIPSLSYIVWERRRKLRAEFCSLSGDQIRELRLSGTDVTVETRIPLVGYMGDSSPAGLDACPDLYRTKILIGEMTFAAPGHRPEKIHKNGHMHLQDYVARKDLFQNDAIIAGHFSTRYLPQQARKFVEDALPDMLGGRLHLWL
jgi:ribonuclease Z